MWTPGITDSDTMFLKASRKKKSLLLKYSNTEILSVVYFSKSQ